MSSIDRKDLIRRTREGRGLIPRSKPIPLLDKSDHLSCVHRGKLKSKTGCVSCGDGVRLKVYHCSVHGECTFEKPAADGSCVKVCRGCEERELPITYIRSSMGLGDMVLLTAVFAHIKAQRPGRRVGLITDRRFAPLFRGLADEVVSDASSRVIEDMQLVYREPRNGSRGVAATNVEFNWLPALSLTPDPRTMRYHVPVPAEHRAAASAFLDKIAPRQSNGKYPVAFVHYQGYSYVDRKNLSHDEALDICVGVKKMGLTPIVHDLDNLCPWGPREGVRRITREDGLLWIEEPSPHILTTAALMELSSLVVAIDSGPQKMAAALSTPTVAVWTGWYPGHCIHPFDHMVHVVPVDVAACTADRCTEHFDDNYRAAYYGHRDNLPAAVLRAAAVAMREPAGALDVEAFSGVRVRTAHRGPDSSIVRDVFHRDEYRLGALPSAKLPEFIVDVGAHIGAFAATAAARWPEARILSVECNPANEAALKANAQGHRDVLMAACSYLSGSFELDDTVIAGSRNTGTSTLVASGVRVMQSVHERGQRRPLAVPVMTLEQIREHAGFPHIDLLKLDCEGSEESILSCADVRSIRMIVGEYHQRQSFLRIVRDRFEGNGWLLREFQTGGGMGIFHLLNQTL